MNGPVLLNRRSVLVGSGALIMSFSLGNACADDQAGPPAPKPPGSLAESPYLDAWIRIDADGTITAFTGKAELGQGFKTAFQQIAAEELDVPFQSVNVITSDTSRTANEGYTSGSNSTKYSGTAIQNAAAQVRELLIAEAARRLELPAESLKTEGAAVIAPDGRKLGYGELVAGDMLHVQAQPKSKLKDPSTYAIMGQPVPRVDIPAKVTGGAAYIQDMRLPGMVHARVVRPPSYGAELIALDSTGVEKLPGVIRVVRDGHFLAVVAAKEYQAVKAMRALSVVAKWRETPRLPKQNDVPKVIAGLPSQDTTIYTQSNPSASGTRTLEATYTRPYQAHGSIGPSCAVAHQVNDAMTVWTHTQGVYPDRAGIAEMLRLPPASVRLIHVEGSGCYGHNGADDAAADAALIARAMPGIPVRVQWMRKQEHAWEPFGPAMVTKLKATLDVNGAIADWNFDVWSNTHSGRAAPARCWPPSTWRNRSRCRPRNRCRCRKAAATATPSRSTSFRTPRSCITSSRKCRFGFRQCAHSAPITTFSRSRVSWMSSRSRPAPIPSNSACSISMIRAGARSSIRRRRRSDGRRAKSRRPVAAMALPSRATRTWPPTAPLQARSR